MVDFLIKMSNKLWFSSLSKYFEDDDSLLAKDESEFKEWEAIWFEWWRIMSWVASFNVS
jgi:hypothetical protein